MPSLFSINRTKIDGERCFREEIQGKINSVVTGRYKYVLCDEYYGSLNVYYIPFSSEVYVIKIKNIDRGIYYSVLITRVTTENELNTVIKNNKDMFQSKREIYIHSMILDMTLTLKSQGVVLGK